VSSGTSEIEDFAFMYNNSLRVHLIDTPGFDDTNKKDVEVLRDIAGWLGVTYQKKIMLSGLIYLHPISDNRLRGSALRNLFMFKKLCGPECMPGIVLATTMWGLVDPQTGADRERELRSTNSFWGEMEQGGSLVMRHQRTKESAHVILREILKRKHPMLLRIQDEMVNQGIHLENTGAGMKVNEDLIEVERQHKKELAELKKDMQDADAASKREIAKLMQEQEMEIERARMQREELKTDCENLARQREEDYKNLQAQLIQQVNDFKKQEELLERYRQSSDERDARQRAELEQMQKDRDEALEDLRESFSQVDRQKTGRHNPLLSKMTLIKDFTQGSGTALVSSSKRSMTGFLAEGLCMKQPVVVLEFITQIAPVVPIVFHPPATWS